MSSSDRVFYVAEGHVCKVPGCMTTLTKTITPEHHHHLSGNTLCLWRVSLCTGKCMDNEKKGNDMVGLLEHARRELELVGVDRKSIDGYLKIIQVFAELGNSQDIAIQTIKALLEFQNLTPLTDDPNEWDNIGGDMVTLGLNVWRSKRNPAAFSTDGGKTYTLIGWPDNKTFSTKMVMVFKKE